MISKSVYICEYCGKQYFNYNDCQKCEDSHTTIDQMEIIDMRYLKDYPTLYNCPNDIKIEVQRPGREPIYLIYSYSNVANNPNVRDQEDPSTW